MVVDIDAVVDDLAFAFHPCMSVKLLPDHSGGEYNLARNSLFSEQMSEHQGSLETPCPEWAIVGSDQDQPRGFSRVFKVNWTVGPWNCGTLPCLQPCKSSLVADDQEQQRRDRKPEKCIEQHPPFHLAQQTQLAKLSGKAHIGDSSTFGPPAPVTECIVSNFIRREILAIPIQRRTVRPTASKYPGAADPDRHRTRKA